MKKKLCLYTAGIIAASILTGCFPSKHLYSWHGYDNVSYAYSKTRTPERELELIETYEKMIQKQSGSRNMVPPGIYAEYGYILAKKGNADKGIQMLEMEIKYYPESEVFINRIIKQLQK